MPDGPAPDPEPADSGAGAAGRYRAARPPVSGISARQALLAVGLVFLLGLLIGIGIGVGL